MSLVAYASSDGSGSEDDAQENKPAADAAVSPVPKKQRDTVRITIPSLKEFQENDSDPPESVKKPKLQTGSGLFSILPAPKYSSSSTTHNFTPHVLKKPQSKAPVSKPSPKTIPKPSESDLPCFEETEEDDDPVVDYFSLEPPKHQVKIQETPASEHLDSSVLFSALPKPIVQHSYSFPSSFDEQIDVAPVSNDAFGTGSGFENQSYSGSCTEESQIPVEPDLLKDKEFLKLKGKGKESEIKFININGEDQLTGKDEWLMQSLTEEKVQRPSKRKHDMPTQQQKRKHQITYLAFQAKERELDLKNQWALNSRTRRETQAKYGF